MTCRRLFSSGSRLFACALVFAGVVHGVFVSRAQAQDTDGGPIIIGRHEKISPFGLTNIRAVLDLIYRYQNDTSSAISQGGNFTEHRLEQTLTLSANSWIVHPNLVDLKLSGTFGL